MTCAAVKPFKPAPNHTDSSKVSAKNVGGQEVMWFTLAAVYFCSRIILVNHCCLIVHTHNFLYVAISFVLCATVVLLGLAKAHFSCFIHDLICWISRSIGFRLLINMWWSLPQLSDLCIKLLCQGTGSCETGTFSPIYTFCGRFE